METLQNYDGAEAKESAFADPETTAKINEWVFNQTEDMIDGAVKQHCGFKNNTV